MFKTILKNKFTYWILLVYVVALTWWLLLQTNWIEYFFSTGDTKNGIYYFYAYYGVISLSGGLYAFRLAYKKWGGAKSVVGRGLIGLGVGLLAETIGLLGYTYYNLIQHVDIPYPSLADIGYFSLIPAYTYAAVMFASAAGAKFSLKTSKGKLQVLLIPLVAFIVAYGLFLKDVGFHGSKPLEAFLNIGYPLGDIIPVSIALLTITLSRRILGGTMRTRIWYLVFAFAFQFATDYYYLYVVGNGTFVDGSWPDLLYFTSYAIMALGIIGFSEYE